MGLRVYDFTCHNGHTTEHFVDPDIVEVECACGALGKRQIATPRFALDGCSGHFPTAADKWEQRRNSHMKKEQKNVAEHGTYK
jgi:hypothetical protein